MTEPSLNLRYRFELDFVLALEDKTLDGVFWKQDPPVLDDLQMTNFNTTRS